MDEVIEFARKLLALEYKNVKGGYREPDEKKYEAIMGPLDAMFADGESGSRRGETPSAKEIAQGAAADAQWNLAPPILFQVKEYEHGKLGHIFLLYMGNFTRDGDSDLNAFLNGYWAQKSKNGLKVISRNQYCAACQSTGVYKGKKCPDCDGAGWIHVGGVEIDDPGKLVAVRKLEAPTDPSSLADYDRDELGGAKKKPAKK